MKNRTLTVRRMSSGDWKIVGIGTARHNDLVLRVGDVLTTGALDRMDRSGAWEIIRQPLRQDWVPESSPTKPDTIPDPSVTVAGTPLTEPTAWMTW